MTKTAKASNLQNIASTSRFKDALHLTYELHADQIRKGTGIPYISHLLGVSATVMKCGGTEDLCIAALLHDALEDQGHKITAQDIQNQFGQKVRSLVVSCTDGDYINRKKIAWRQRKEAYINHMKTLTAEEMLLAVADKLDNGKDIERNLCHIGESYWDKFNGKKAGMLWYQQSLLETMELWLHLPQAKENQYIPLLINEFRQICNCFIPPLYAIPQQK